MSRACLLNRPAAPLPSTSQCLPFLEKSISKQHLKGTRGRERTSSTPLCLYHTVNSSKRASTAPPRVPGDQREGLYPLVPARKLHGTKPTENSPALIQTAKSSYSANQASREGVRWRSRIPTLAAARGSQPRPCTLRPAPPFAGFPDSALLPPRAARDPRCMCNGGWEQRRAGPSAPAAAHQPPRLPQTSPWSFKARLSTLPRAAWSHPNPSAEPVAARTPNLGAPSTNRREKSVGKSISPAELRIYTPASTHSTTRVREER